LPAFLQLAVTGEIPDARSVPVSQVAVRPTVARSLIAIVPAKTKDIK